MAEAMMRAPLLFALSTFALLVQAQEQWLAPGACWDRLGTFVGPQIMSRYRYVGDTVVDGYSCQMVHRRDDTFYPSGIWSPIFVEYYRMQGAAVMTRCDGWLCPPNPPWDTLLYLGNPGDRWRGGYHDPDCYPFGILEIQDTAHVVIQGITLRTWDLARLDQNGLPIPEEDLPNYGDSLCIIERLGGNIRAFPQPCDGGFIDYYWYTQTHYSDVDITLPEGSTCDLITTVPQPSIPTIRLIGSNEGFSLIGLGPSVARVEVLDSQGRIAWSVPGVQEQELVEPKGLQPGMYLVAVRFSNGHQQALHWLKQ